MGQRAPQDAPAAINDVASVMVAAPEGTVLLQSGGWLYLSLYVEGMMAPVGSFSNYRRQARALRVLDDRLKEYDPATIGLPFACREVAGMINRAQSASSDNCVLHG